MAVGGAGGRGAGWLVPGRLQANAASRTTIRSFRRDDFELFIFFSFQKCKPYNNYPLFGPKFKLSGTFGHEKMSGHLWPLHPSFYAMQARLNKSMTHPKLWMGHASFSV
jgi:hypothetical protein